MGRAQPWAVTELRFECSMCVTRDAYLESKGGRTEWDVGLSRHVEIDTPLNHIKTI